VTLEDIVEDILRVVDERETPTREDRAQMLQLAETLRKKVEENARKYGIKADVRIEGSVAKDTWLRSSKEIDIFMHVPPALERDKLGTTCLDIARDSVEGYRWVERFAEHPYLEAYAEGDVRINIVPCYKVEKGRWKSATDRTPFHTEYIKARLRFEWQKREIRFLKRFMKGIDAYGADVKVGGFSGYLIELISLYYGNFIEALRKASEWKLREIIDPENYYKKNLGDAEKLFDEPLIVIDPVDWRRNVASAVRIECLDKFRSAAKFFLRKPSLNFFYPPPVKPLDHMKIKKVLEKRDADLLFIIICRVEAVPDILWGQLYKTCRSISKLLKQYDFNVLRSKVWSDEKSSSVIVFELETATLKNLKKHWGPPILSQDETKFIEKYATSEGTVSGPWVENGRWVTLIQRRHSSATDLLREKLANGGVSVGVASRIAKSLETCLQIKLNQEILEFYRRNRDFKIFLTKFLKGKPDWLE
jgi:tRNA nucleotidyltransferase (CCA-adding enzyme)